MYYMLQQLTILCANSSTQAEFNAYRLQGWVTAERTNTKLLHVHAQQFHIRLNEGAQKQNLLPASKALKWPTPKFKMKAWNVFEESTLASRAATLTSMASLSKMRSCRKSSSLIFLSWKSSSIWAWASSSCWRTLSMWLMELLWGVLLLEMAESLKHRDAHNAAYFKQRWERCPLLYKLLRPRNWRRLKRGEGGGGQKNGYNFWSWRLWDQEWWKQFPSL